MQELVHETMRQAINGALGAEGSYTKRMRIFFVIVIMTGIFKFKGGGARCFISDDRLGSYKIYKANA